MLWVLKKKKRLETVETDGQVNINNFALNFFAYVDLSALMFLYF